MPVSHSCMDEMAERLDVVDNQDRIIGTCLRSEKAKGHITRVSIVLLHHAGKVLLCKRAPHKQFFPGRLDASVCGNVGLGESYADAAARELNEELNVNVPFTYAGKFLHEFQLGTDTVRHFAALHIAEYSGDFVRNDETDEHVWLELEEASRLIKEQPEQFVDGLIDDWPILERALRQPS